MKNMLIPTLLLTAAFAGAAFTADTAGRYKKQGDKCVWDATDTGPNQCTPIVEGRFKREGARCVWAGNETGRDQCRPSTGRFKDDGGRCVWDAKDNGPDQCDPHTAK